MFALAGAKVAMRLPHGWLAPFAALAASIILSLAARLLG